MIPTVYFANRHPSAYEDPQSFRPERFLDKKPDPYAWIPFGGGIRRCVGMAFAIYEMKAVIATVLSRFEVTAAKPDRPRAKLRAFTHAPVGGAEVVLRPRVAAAREQSLSA